MFEAQTRDFILTRLRGYYAEAQGPDVSSVEGTFSFDTLAANAKEFEAAYAEMDLIVDAAFPQTSWGEYLDKQAEALAGITRRAATQAIAVLTITGTAGVPVPAGSLFASTTGINFTTNEEVVIGSNGTVAVKATAQSTGPEGNVAAETITEIPVTIYGVSAVNNADAAYNGYAEEIDSDLLERLLFKVRQPATSGNVYHYIVWATSVSGVGAVKVLPLWNGNGTVKVIVVHANTDTPSEDLLQAVRDKIAEESPIGATVTVVAPITQTIDISLTCTDGTGSADAIKAVLTKYFKENVFGTDYTDIAGLDDDVTISYAQIGRIILDNSATTGVNDYSNLLVNGDTVNITVTAECLPVVGTVTVNEP